MNNTKAQIKLKIMKQVFGFWFLRSMAPLLLIELIVIAIGLYFFAKFVFVSEVVDNALAASLGNPLRLVGYLWGAFLITNIQVQITIVVLILVVVFLLWHINRSFISYALTRRTELFDTARDA